MEDLTYTYDAAGNRLTTGGTFARSNIPPALATTSYNANNQQTTFGTSTETYDLNGNLATFTDVSGTTTYTWNARNQLISLSGPGLTASFAYDSFGRRTGKTINATTTNFVYDGLNPIQEKNGVTVTANLLTGLGIDEFFTRTDGVGVRSLLPDALGSTVALGDGTGTLQTQYTYEPFGVTTQTGAASTNSYKYTGREDDGTGLAYYRARYYQPRLQRFVSEDPIGFRGGDVNLYGYARNRVTVFADPLGLFEIKASVLIGITNYQLDIAKLIRQQQIDISKETVFPPNIGAGLQCKIDEPPSYIDHQFSIDVGVSRHLSVGTNFIPNPDFDGSNQSYLTQGLNFNIGFDLLRTGGAISAPQR